MLKLRDIFTEEELKARKAQRQAEYLEFRMTVPTRCDHCRREDHGRNEFLSFNGSWLYGRRCGHCGVWICREAIAGPAHASTSGAH
jgi:hypothetical protein